MSDYLHCPNCYGMVHKFAHQCPHCNIALEPQGRPFTADEQRTIDTWTGIISIGIIIAIALYIAKVIWT